MNPQSVWIMELSNARSFREQGFEGKARVCARRAVGFAIASYHSRNGRNVASPNAINLMNQMLEENLLPAGVATSLVILLQRVNAAGELDGSPDLIECAQIVIDHLFPGANYGSA